MDWWKSTEVPNHIQLLIRQGIQSLTPIQGEGPPLGVGQTAQVVVQGVEQLDFRQVG